MSCIQRVDGVSPGGGGGGGGTSDALVTLTGQTTDASTITLGTIATLSAPGDSVIMMNWFVIGRTADAGRGGYFGRIFSQRNFTVTSSNLFTNTGGVQFGAGTGWSNTNAPSVSGSDVVQTVTGEAATTISWTAFGLVRTATL